MQARGKLQNSSWVSKGVSAWLQPYLVGAKEQLLDAKRRRLPGLRLPGEQEERRIQGGRQGGIGSSSGSLSSSPRRSSRLACSALGQQQQQQQQRLQQRQQHAASQPGPSPPPFFAPCLWCTGAAAPYSKGHAQHALSGALVSASSRRPAQRPPLVCASCLLWPAQWHQSGQPCLRAHPCNGMQWPTACTCTPHECSAACVCVVAALSRALRCRMALSAPWEVTAAAAAAAAARARERERSGSSSNNSSSSSSRGHDSSSGGGGRSRAWLLVLGRLAHR